MEISYCSTTVRNINLFFVDCVFCLKIGLQAVRRNQEKISLILFRNSLADTYWLFVSVSPARAAGPAGMEQ